MTDKIAEAVAILADARRVVRANFYGALSPPTLFAFHTMRRLIKRFTVVLLVALFAGCNGPKASAPLSSSGKQPTWQVVPGQPTYYINSTAISGDGSKVVGGTFFHSYGASSGTTDSQTGTFGTYCYDKAGNRLWKNEFTGWQGVYWVDISTNGAVAASGGWFSQTPSYAGFVRAFNATNGNVLLDARTSERVNQVVLSADGTWLLSAADSLCLFQLVNGMFQRSDAFVAPAVTTGSNYFISAGLSAQGDTVVASDYAGHIMLLSVADGKFSLVKQWSLPSAYSHMVRLTPDGSAFVCGGPSGTFYFFDAAQFASSGQPTTMYSTGQGGSVYSVAIADDASAFVGVANYQSTLGMVYYVTRSGSQCSLKWSYQTAHNPNCAWLNQSLLAIADGHPDGSPGAFYLLNTADGSLRWQYPTGNMSWPIMISRDGSGIVAGSDDANIYYFTP